MPGWALILLMFALVAALLFLVRLIGLSGGRKESARAVLLSKRTGTAPRSRIYQTPLAVYSALFRLEDGREIELGLDGADFAPLREGARGVLAWRDGMFLSFREDAPSGREAPADPS